MEKFTKYKISGRNVEFHESAQLSATRHRFDYLFSGDDRDQHVDAFTNFMQSVRNHAQYDRCLAAHALNFSGIAPELTEFEVLDLPEGHSIIRWINNRYEFATRISKVPSKSDCALGHGLEDRPMWGCRNSPLAE